MSTKLNQRQMSSVAMGDNEFGWSSSVLNMYNKISQNSVLSQTANMMIEETISEFGGSCFNSIEQMCDELNKFIKQTPQFNQNFLCGCDISQLYFNCSANHSGLSFFLNSEINLLFKNILNEWKEYLDSDQSFTITNNGNWLCEEAKRIYKFDDYITDFNDIPYFKSWNSFFTRKLKAGRRAFEGMNDNNIIQIPNDGTFIKYNENIKLKDKFWIKTIPYSLTEIFSNHAYGKLFENGNIFQTYLRPFDYHNYHAPVSGTIKDIITIDGAYFSYFVWMHSELESNENIDGTISLPWWLHINARSILIIDTKEFANCGLIAYVAVGMGEISSIDINCKIGDIVNKGDCIGCFKYGGSSIAVITQDLKIFNKSITCRDDLFIMSRSQSPVVKVGQTMAVLSSLPTHLN